MIYLDNSATTKPSEAVVKAMTEVLTEGFGNPSALYRIGLDAEKRLKSARQAVAKSIGASAEEVFFTSGGTESDNTAIRGIWNARKKQGNRIITTSVEHPAVLRVCEQLEREGADVVYLPVGADCSFDMDAFRKALTAETILVTVMYVNNEAGSIMPLRAIREEINKVSKEIVFHTDAVQAYGKIECDVKKLGVDMLSLSAHKIHGPKGIGALYVRKGLHVPPFVYGGGQESGFRSGTENVPGIVGLGTAASEIDLNWKNYPEMFREMILSRIPDVKINSPEKGAPSILNVSILGCRSEVLLHTLEQDQIYVSAGSACSSKKKGSHVLAAMGLKPEEIEGALRFSFSRDTTAEELEETAGKLARAAESQRSLRKAFKR